MRKITEIFIHCSATPASWMEGKGTAAKVAEVRRWHTEERGWSDIGYHFLIDRSGRVMQGRPEEEIGAHVKGHNRNSLGVCLIGGKGSRPDDLFLSNYTLAQQDALKALIADLKGRYPKAKVRGHNEVANKACPGFNVKAWYAKEQPSRTNPVQSKTVQATVVQSASAVGGALGAINALNGVAQIVALVGCFVVLLAAGWIFKERLRKWAEGDR